MATKKETMSAKAAEENPAVKRGRKPRLDENGEELRISLEALRRGLSRLPRTAFWLTTAYPLIPVI